ncbi:MAG: FecR domain-containing protein [Mangrovibacterium sp.]
MEDNIHNLIIRLFDGEANPEEKRQIKDWLEQDEKNRSLYADLKEIWLSGSRPSEYDIPKAVQKFLLRIRKPEQSKRILIQMLRYAALVLLILSIPFSFFLGKRFTGTGAEFTTITCAFGDKSTILLPDNTEVNLNSGSTLVFENDFTHRRNVTLCGEAFFKVAKNEKLPFVVNASDLELKVLGTSFNVKAYPDEDNVSATLVEGRIQVTSGSAQLELSAYQKVTYDTHNKEMKVAAVSDVDPEIEWKDGRLVFRNESLGEMELKLERWFDVDIDLADEAVANRRFTGSLDRESILEALSYFANANALDYSINKNRITFYTPNN